jgi:hypothetical protein
MVRGFRVEARQQLLSLGFETVHFPFQCGKLAADEVGLFLVEG